MRLCAEVIDFVRANCFDELIERRPIGQVAVDQLQPHIFIVRILVDMVEPRGIKRRRSANHAKNFVPFAQQQLGQIRAILARDACHECPFADLRWIRWLHPTILVCISLETKLMQNSLNCI